jgi:LysR family hydrogen peroxide-inducible transcriptional activator
MDPIDRLDALSLRDLRALTALAQHRHFGRAAQEMGISQPSLSAAIQKVELCLKTKVFERTSRRCDLTAKGAAIVEQAHIALGELARLASLSTKQRNRLEGRFRLGIIPTVAPYYLPHIFGAVLEKFPSLELILREEISDTLIERLRAGEIDAALLSLPLHEADLLEFPILQEELALAVPLSHPLAARSEVSVSDLKPREMVLLEHGHCLRDQTLELCAANSPNGCIHATSLETLRFMVKAKIGTALVPAMAVHFDHNRDLVRYVPFCAPAPSRTLGITVSRRSEQAGDAEELAYFLGSLDIGAARFE